MNKQEGADAAFDSFLSESYSKLVGAVFLIVGDKPTAEDVVQETMARAYMNWSKLWPDGNPGGWSYRVAVNLATSWRRRVFREAKAVARLGRQAPQPGPDELIDPDLERLVAGLPLRQRQAVALHYGMGMSMEEVANAMGCRVGTVKSSLHAARQRLKKDLDR